jgi:uncharacterized protein
MKWPEGCHLLFPTIPVYVLEGARPGPCAIVQAGIHGDEVAGVHALQELLEAGFRPDSGRLLIIPVMNPGAYRARQRKSPGGLDMNRCFPGNAESAAIEERLAQRFMDLVEAERPALVVTLHESWKRFHPAVPASFGQTIVYGVRPLPAAVERVVERMNESLQSPYELWAAHYYPVPTSSTEVIVDRTACLGACVETWMGFEESRRIAMAQQTVRYFLEELGLLSIPSPPSSK